MPFPILPQSVRTVAPPPSCCSIALRSPPCRASSLVHMAKATCVFLSQLRLRRSKPVGIDASQSVSLEIKRMLVHRSPIFLYASFDDVPAGAIKDWDY